MFLQSLALAGTWEEDFDDGKAGEWNEITGKWEIDKKAYVETAQTEYAKTIIGDETWTDYTVEVDITLTQPHGGTNCAGLLIRINENGENGFRYTTWRVVDFVPM